MLKSTETLAKTILDCFGDWESKSASDQMATYISVGRKLGDLFFSGCKYGANGEEDIISLVPQLRDPQRIRDLLDFSEQDEAGKMFILEQSAIPMSNGQPLAIEHWLWLHEHLPHRSEQAEQEEWQLRHLEWLRRLAPPAAVVQEFTAASKERHWRQRDITLAKVEEAILLLQRL